jgi:hypothetical protein
MVTDPLVAVGIFTVRKPTAPVPLVVVIETGAATVAPFANDNSNAAAVLVMAGAASIKEPPPTMLPDEKIVPPVPVLCKVKFTLGSMVVIPVTVKLLVFDVVTI